jgi:hypothetical protein
MDVDNGNLPDGGHDAPLRSAGVSVVRYGTVQQSEVRGSRCGRDGHGEGGDVVVWVLDRGGELLYAGDYGGGGGGGAGEEVGEVVGAGPAFAEAQVGDAVGVEHESVARVQVDGGGAVGGVGEQSGGGTGARHGGGGPVATDQQGWWVPGDGDGEPVANRLGLESAVGEGAVAVFVGFRVENDGVVQVGQHAAGSSSMSAAARSV